MGTEALRVARELAARQDPRQMAAASGAAWIASDDATGRFEFDFLGRRAVVSWPELEPTLIDSPPLPPHVAALLVYYIGGAADVGPAGRWISFAQLPDGTLYSQAFQGYTGNALVRHFAGKTEALAPAATALGGAELPGMADRAWRFEALPKVAVALLWWDADDEFEARAELLFDASASRHLPTDGCAVLGSWLTRGLVATAEAAGAASRS